MDGNFCGTCGADTRGMCTCPSESAECETCGGDGVVVYETFRNGRDVEDEEECPDCGGLGCVDDDGNDPDDRPLPSEDRTGLKDAPL